MFLFLWEPCCLVPEACVRAFAPCVSPPHLVPLVPRSLNGMESDGDENGTSAFRSGCVFCSRASTVSGHSMHGKGSCSSYLRGQVTRLSKLEPDELSEANLILHTRLASLLQALPAFDPSGTGSIVLSSLLPASPVPAMESVAFAPSVMPGSSFIPFSSPERIIASPQFLPWTSRLVITRIWHGDSLRDRLLCPSPSPDCMHTEFISTDSASVHELWESHMVYCSSSTWALCEALDVEPESYFTDPLRYNSDSAEPAPLSSASRDFGFVAGSVVRDSAAVPAAADEASAHTELPSTSVESDHVLDAVSPVMHSSSHAESVPVRVVSLAVSAPLHISSRFAALSVTSSACASIASAPLPPPARLPPPAPRLLAHAAAVHPPPSAPRDLRSPTPVVVLAPRLATALVPLAARPLLPSPAGPVVAAAAPPPVHQLHLLLALDHAAIVAEARSFCVVNSSFGSAGSAVLPASMWLELLRSHINLTSGFADLLMVQPAELHLMELPLRLAFVRYALQLASSADAN